MLLVLYFSISEMASPKESVFSCSSLCWMWIIQAQVYTYHYFFFPLIFSFTCNCYRTASGVLLLTAYRQNSGVRSLVEKERCCLLKGYTVLEQWQVSASEPLSLWNTRRLIILPPFAGQTSSRKCLESLLPLLKVLSFEKHRCLQHDHSGSLAGSWSQFGSRHLTGVCVPLLKSCVAQPTLPPLSVLDGHREHFQTTQPSGSTLSGTQNFCCQLG